eukprot:6554345-Alexandrium_andersonii.AAC.1
MDLWHHGDEGMANPRALGPVGVPIRPVHPAGGLPHAGLQRSPLHACRRAGPQDVEGLAGRRGSA